MKKFPFVFLLFTLMSVFVQGQITKPVTIPSFRVPVDSGTVALFRETTANGHTKSILEKRDVHVKITDQSSGGGNCGATVWIYSLDGLDVLGPYTAPCGETLVVEIDERAWGVLVQSIDDIVVDVWIE
ncbi:MAG: hypothetical protein NT004_10790 [Bacteroidetes bacterium]|nr:hypothetical protein [Bacteroidota bacterium]